jgi:hypothetical protein
LNVKNILFLRTFLRFDNTCIFKENNG